MPPLIRLAWRYLLRHPWQSVLMVLGITLGVAVVVAIDLANASATRAFDLSTEAVTGRATHQLVTGPAGIDESVIVTLRQAGLEIPSAPIVSAYASSPQLGSTLFRVLGLDPFAEAPFRDYLGGQVGNENRQPLVNLLPFLTQPGAILISETTAQRYGKSACTVPASACQLELNINGRSTTVFIAGLLNASDNLSRRALDSLILVDIATAQELTGRIGRLDYIDLIIKEDDLADPAISPMNQIENLLPSEVRLVPVEARTGTVEQMTAAFRVNLSALSMLALVVGVFLIYNSMTFSVVQRRPLFGTLRCLGVTRREIFILVLAEAFIVGLFGSIFGVVLGILMGQGAVQLVTTTINDLFFVLNVRGVQIPPVSLVKGAALGILATLLTAAPPAWEAASVAPRAALSRSGLESKARRAVNLAGLSGLALLTIAGGMLLIPTRNLVFSFIATFAVIIGFAMLAPVTTALFMRVVSPPLGLIWGSLGRMAPRDVVNSLSRTSIAVAALMVAVSVTIGVALMVGSFRKTVVAWLDQTLSGDIYISAPGLTASQTSAPINPQVFPIFASHPAVIEVLTLRSVEIDSPAGPIHIAASSNADVTEERTFLSQTVPAVELNRSFLEGAVVVSEPLANRLGLARTGSSIQLYTDSGLREFPVVGIYNDYSSTQGSVLMYQGIYQQHWQDEAITAIALRLAQGSDSDMIVRQLREQVSKLQLLQIRPNLALREEVLEVFDRTFAITGALQLLATVVAFIGVLSALLSVELERQREFGILRAIGLTTRQLWGLILLETGLMGTIAGLLSLPTGYALALILVYIINRRSFGWTLQMSIVIDPFVQAIIVALLAAVLAGIYPARRMSRMLAADAIRYE